MTDPHFDRALRAAARRGRGDAGPCPDAALLAAYVDRGLAPDEHAAVETHVADCSRCQEHLALLAATDAPDEPAPLPAHSWNPGTLLPRWGWLVPVATAVLLVVIWSRLPDRTPEQALPAPEQRSRDAGTAAELPRSNERKDAGANAPAPKVEGFAAGGRKQDERAANALADSAGTAATDTLASKPRPSTTSAPAPAAPVAQGTPAATAAEPVPAPAEERQESAVTAGRLMAKSARPPLLVHAPGAVQVRAVGTRLERSTDGGSTWTAERDDAADTLTAGVCPSADVCWLAGQAAAWVRQDDGTWTRHPLPPGPSVTAITATDRRHATIIRSDSTTLSTADGGASWGPGPAR